MYYKDLDLSSNKIDTLLLSGGGTKGIVYLGLIKYLDKYNYLENINKYYGVSVGGVIVLLLNLGYKYNELENILLNEINYNEIIKINSKSILNLFDKFSVADSTYFENLIKSLIERKGFNPYINFKQLYQITKKEINLGFVKCFKNEFILANHINRPDMPIWLAVRASASIPFIFQPVIDAINGFDLLIDGGVINNNLIGIYLNEKYNNTTTKNKIKNLKLNVNNIATQFPENTNNNNNNNDNNNNINNENNNINNENNNINNENNNINNENNNNNINNENNNINNENNNINNGNNSINNENNENNDINNENNENNDINNENNENNNINNGNNENNENNDINNENNENNETEETDETKLFEHNFICVSLETNKNNLFESIVELNKIKFQNYLLSIIKKIYFNQDGNKYKYLPYIYKIDCSDYDIDIANTSLNNEEILNIINDTYKLTDKYFKTIIKNKTK